MNNNGDFLHFTLNKKLWFDVKLDDYARYDYNRYISSTDKFLGNLCLLRPQDDIDYRTYTSTIKLDTASDRLKDSGYYWAENRPYLKTYSNSEITAGTYTDLFSLGLNGAITCYEDDSNKYDNGLIKWATAAEEENSYWLETNNSNSIVLPITWGEIDDDVEGFTEHGFTCFEGVDRHPSTLSNNNYIVKCEIDDIDSIYAHFTNVSISPYPSAVTYGSVELFLDQQIQLRSLGKLYIIEGTEPQLIAPSIALDSTTSSLTITDNNSEGATEYFELYVNGNMATTVVKAESGDTEYDLTDLGLAVGTYSIKLRAVGSGYRTSGDSNVVAYNVDPAPTPKLSTPVINDLTAGVLSWNIVEHATSYTLLGGPSTISGISSTSIDLSGLSWPVGTYVLTITAQATGYIDSDESTSVNYVVAPTPAQLDAPTNLSVSEDTLSFDEVQDAETYEVFANGSSIGVYDPAQHGGTN